MISSWLVRMACTKNCRRPRACSRHLNEKNLEYFPIFCEHHVLSVMSVVSPVRLGYPRKWPTPGTPRQSSTSLVIKKKPSRLRSYAERHCASGGRLDTPSRFSLQARPGEFSLLIVGTNSVLLAIFAFVLWVRRALQMDARNTYKNWFIASQVSPVLATINCRKRVNGSSPALKKIA